MLENRSGMDREAVGFGGRGNSTPGAHKQLGAEVIGECPELLAHGARSEADLLGGASHAGSVQDGEKDAEIVPRQDER